MADSSLAKVFEFKDLISEWGTYDSSFDKTNLSRNFFVRGSLNVYKKLSGTLANRPGQKRIGVANNIASPVSSEFVWNTSWGATYVLVVSNSTLYVIVDDIWYPLQTSLTKTRYVFDKWWDNSLKQDQALFVDGTDNMYSWGGGFAKIVSTTATTIVLDRTIVASFLPASGSVIINGTIYTYSGSSGSTLTGVSPSPVGEAPGSGVIETVVTTATTPSAGFANDFLKVINNQVYVGSYVSRLIYISSNTDFTDYVVPTPRAPGDPELITLDGTGKGIGVRQGNAYVGFGSGSWAIITFNNITVGTTLTQQTVVDVKPVSNLQAPLAHEFIDTVGDSLVYLAQDHQLRTFGDFNNLFTPGYPSFSQEIVTELMEENFNGGGLKCIGEFTYITAPASGRAYLYQVRQSVRINGEIAQERIWHAPFTWNATRIDQVDGLTVSFSNANPQMYQVWDTAQWHDDSPSDEPLPYTSILALSYRGEARRQGLWSFDKHFTEGYITAGSTLLLRMNYDYQGATNAIITTINSPELPGFLFTPNGATATSLGETSLGDKMLGDDIVTTVDDQDALPKFKVINSLPLINCFEWQPVFYSDLLDARWEILAEGTNAVIEADQNATFLINKKRTNKSLKK